ncbi:MAG: hypothetical protein HN617_12485 [Planctomycetaceae bacterium]|jgi:hypothetical protein|nr:hypothetical protein [Planctomycetaceae bacterium]MBT4725429.1 hypothetical protein [Planctomycetaceae bacterium]MBT4846968.1 hypothetical protein [Planctomycetaceae bacterium]MBT5123200.1 hypothetical protein [Planctomycetaceae bacterium]MBT5597648.1 hypothetical protein [Planctomycetaceae bacterium]
MSLIPKFKSAAFALLIACTTQFVTAQTTPSELLTKYAPADIAAAHEIWHVSTRGLAQYDQLEQDVAKIEYLQLVSGQWKQRTANDFNASQGVDTCFLIHGSPASTELVLQVTLDVYQHIRPVITDAHNFRYVIWSWPADRQVGGIVKEFKDQAIRSQPQGFYLARIVDGCRARNRTLVVGYSMGARVSACALHLLGGGSNPYTPQLKPQSDHKVTYLTVGGAIDQDWLEPGKYFGNALTVVDQYLNVHNPADPLLKRYKKLAPKTKSAEPGVAIGYHGLTNIGTLKSFGIPTAQMNVTDVAGKSHDIRYITRDVNLIKEIWNKSFPRRDN